MDLTGVRAWREGAALALSLSLCACGSGRKSGAEQGEAIQPASVVDGELTPAPSGPDAESSADIIEAKGGSVATGPVEKPAEPAVPKMPRLELDPVSELRDPSPSVRFSAIEDLARDPSPEAVEAVVSAVGDSDLSVGLRAGEALGRLYMEGRVPVETMIEKGGDPTIPFKSRMGVLSALSRKPDPAAAAYLVRLAKTGSPEERRMAVGMLGYQGPDVAVPTIIEALEDSDEWVRYNAAEALRHISRGRDFGRDRAAWEAWWRQASERRSPRRGDRG